MLLLGLRAELGGEPDREVLGDLGHLGPGVAPRSRTRIGVEGPGISNKLLCGLSSQERKLGVGCGEGRGGGLLSGTPQLLGVGGPPSVLVLAGVFGGGRGPTGATAHAPSPLSSMAPWAAAAPPTRDRPGPAARWGPAAGTPSPPAPRSSPTWATTAC